MSVHGSKIQDIPPKKYSLNFIEYLTAKKKKNVGAPKIFSIFLNSKGVVYMLYLIWDEIHPGVNSLRSLKKSLILFTRNKRGEISTRTFKDRGEISARHEISYF